MSAHKNVMGYDGAFRCRDCGESWGALPGRPDEPAVCTPPTTADRLAAELGRLSRSNKASDILVLAHIEDLNKQIEGLTSEPRN